MNFNIEKVKWSWAPSVKNPDVYRDDEFVRTKTKEETLQAIDFLMGKPIGLTYTISVFRDNEYFTYWRHSMPCLGGLVKYRDSHGERYFMNPYFPRDIRVAFPDGDIIFIACHRLGTKDIFNNPYYEFIFSEESPWLSAFGSKETIIFKDNYFILTNMNTDPTVFYSLMRLGKLSYNWTPQYPGWHPKAIILASCYMSADPRRLAGQKPLLISGGTWADGFGYTRPYNESIFKTKLPNKLADFGSVGCYPPAPHTNEYFISEMKKIFGVDISKINNDEKTGDVLLKSWDFFKEESKNLSEHTDKSIIEHVNIYKS